MDALTEQSRLVTEQYSPDEVATLCKALAETAVLPGPKWMQAFMGQLEKSDVSHMSAEGVNYLIAALDTWSVPIPPTLATSLAARLPELVREEIPTAIRLLQYLCNQRPPPAPQQLLPAFQLLQDALVSGQLQPTFHASVVYCAARALRGWGPGGDDEGEDEGAASSSGDVFLEEQLLPAALHASSAAMATYSAEVMATVFVALASVDAQFTTEWLERFYEYSRPQVCVRDMR